MKAGPQRMARVAISLLLTIAAATLFGTATPQSQAPFRPLFNGRNLDGWEMVGPGRWTVEEGAIVMRRPADDHAGGWLVTRRDYGDFILRLQVMPGNDLYNSGVLIRDPGHAKVGRPALNGFEIKLAQGDRIENGNATIWYVSNAPIKSIPAHEWTSFEIRCQGDHIVTLMNGQKMAEVHTRRSYSGGIGLHLHGGSDEPEVRFRNIEIQELPAGPRPDQLMEEKLTEAPGEFASVLPDVTTSSEWTLRDGVLKGSAKGQDTSLTAAGTFSDFLLSFDFRVSAGGNAGIAFHGDREFRIADKDEAFPTGSVPGVARGFFTEPCLQTIYHPGRWNQAKLYVSGDHVVTSLNLFKAADGHSAGSTQGPLGFRAGAGTTVEFRDVRIKKIR